MAISMAMTLRNNRLDQITSFAGGSAKLELFTAGATLIVTCVCNATFAPAASGGVLTLNAITSGTAIATGTVTNATLYKSDGTTVVLSGLTVGTSGSNVNLSSVLVSTGDSVVISSATITEGNA